MLSISQEKKFFVASVDGDEISKSTNLKQVASDLVTECPQEVELFLLQGKGNINLHEDDKQTFKQTVTSLYYEENNLYGGEDWN